MIDPFKNLPDDVTEADLDGDRYEHLQSQEEAKAAAQEHDWEVETER